MIVVLSVVFIVLGFKAYKIFALKHFENVYTLDNKCKAIIYKDKVVKKYDKSIIDRVSKLN